jgi:hypothetical protein
MVDGNAEKRAADDAKEVMIILHDPVVVSQAPVGLKEWGPWQFPLVERLDDGRLLVNFNKEADSATAYGSPMGQAVSADEGATWREVPAPGIVTGLRLPNGDLLRAFQRPSPPASGLNMPKPLAHVPSSYNTVTYTYYRRSEVPPDLQAGWYFRRRLASGSTWVEEQARVEVPDDLVYTTENVFVFPYFEHDRIQVAPDGRLVATLYSLPQMVRGRTLVRRFFAMLMESSDSGRTWRVKGSIPYRPDPDADPEWDARDGFTEPQIGYLPDGSILCLLRTTDGNGIGPMYITRSKDDGVTWSTPRVFDDCGVWPQVLTVKNGVTLVSYGRPGLYVRATNDPSGMKWGKRMIVVQPGPLAQDTCSYSDMIALTDHEALIVYSHFTFPDGEGRPRKTILARRIEIR